MSWGVTSALGVTVRAVPTGVEWGIRSRRRKTRMEKIEVFCRARLTGKEIVGSVAMA